MRYLAIILLILIMIACLFKSSNTTEGLENNSNGVNKYNESLNRIDNMLNLIDNKSKNVDIRGKSLERLNSQVKYLTYAKKLVGLMIEQSVPMEQLRKLTTPNMKTNNNMDNNMDNNMNNNMDNNMDNNMENMETQQYTNDETNNSPETQKEIDALRQKIDALIKESNIINKQMTDMRNMAQTKTPPDMIYAKLDLMIQGKSTSYGADASTTYTIPLKDNGDIDPDKFYDYIDDETVKRKADSVDQSGTAWVLDKDGNMVSLASQSKLNDYIKYYEPGSYKYDIQNYTPSYEDSVYLSKTTGKPAFSKFIDNASIKKGICSQYKDFPDKLDEECGKLDKNVCGSVNCCTLLGGSKCVAGNNQGPLSKLHYGNQMIKNRDFYYYKGLCYGNCIKTKTDQ